MTLLDPKNTDVADLLNLIRDIGDRLDGIEDMLGSVDLAVELHDGKLNALIATEPGHERAVGLAVEAVLADMEDRRSLIPVHDDDGEYKPHCASCLLKKNGYPRLAKLLTDAGPDGEED